MNDDAQTPLRASDSDSGVLDVQARLASLGYPIPPSERGGLGDATVRAISAFQARRGIRQTGTLDRQTWRELVEAGWTLGSRTLYRRLPYIRGDDVRDLQMRLNALGFDAGFEDGIFGKATYAAVLEFQRNAGLPSDGIVARQTVEALHRLRRQIRPGSKAELRRRIAREDGGLAGRVVFIDPGHGGQDFGEVTSQGVPEAHVVYRVAETASEYLRDQEAIPVLSRKVQQQLHLDGRISRANAERADLSVSVHVACHPEPGPWVAYRVVDGRESVLGRDLAQAVAARLRSRLNATVAACGRNLEFLRQTSMPSVVVDLSCADDDSLLAEDPYLVGLGEAIALGVRDYFCTDRQSPSA